MVLPALLLGTALSALPVLPDAPGLDSAVAARATAAFARAREEGLVQRAVLTIIDYRLPSSEKRLWVFDLAAKQVLFHERVAHGRGTGVANATRFGDEPGSLRSSLGVFLTGGTYSGKNGYSLTLSGLEPGFNDLAQAREIVMHGAWYVSEEFVRKNGRTGRSWGCPAVDAAVAQPLIDAIKSGPEGPTLLVADYPDPDWLTRSAFVAPSASR